MNDTEIRAELAESDHVVRYVRPRSVLSNGRASGDAFRLRPHEVGLSVNWLECFAAASKQEQVDKVIALSRITMSKNGRLAELNVGNTRAKTRDACHVRFIRHPLPTESGHPEDPSHCEITGLPAYGSLQAAVIGDLIADTVNETYPAVSSIK